MNAPHFTVLLPVNRPPELLPFSIESVLAQESVEFELFVICDGAPGATVECARAYAERDPRVRVFVFDKGERHGEAHRHTALLDARYPLVAQIGDDDLWFPDYLATLGRLLERVDFGNLLQADLSAAGAVRVHTGDLADAAIRNKMCREAWNFFGPSAAGYQLSAYRQLPVGWSPAPPDLWTDLHMWRKFLSRDDLAFGTTFAVRGVKLSAAERAGMPLADRAAELAALATQFQNPRAREDFAARAFKSAWRELDRALTATHQTLERSQADALEQHRRREADARDLTIRLDELNNEIFVLRSLAQSTADERDASLAAYHQILSSKSWSATKPLRWIKQKI